MSVKRQPIRGDTPLTSAIPPQVVKRVGSSEIRLIRQIPDPAAEQQPAARRHKGRTFAHDVIFAPGDASSSPRVKNILADVAARARKRRA